MACDFIGGLKAEEAIPLFESLFVKTGNQYSHDNSFVFEEAGEDFGSITAYDGKHLIAYRENFLQFIAQE